MTPNGFENLSGMLTAREIGLGWLLGVTLQHASHALSLQPHQHAHPEAIFCLKGELRYEIAGLPPVTLGAGTGIIIPERTVHVLHGGTEAPGERLGFHLARRLATPRPYAVFSPADYLSFRRTLDASAGRPFRLGKNLAESIRELAAYVRRPAAEISTSEMGLVRILCCTVLYRVVRLLSEPLVPVRPHLMAEATAFLEAHYAEAVKSEDLVRHMGYSRARLFTLFKEFTGLTPNDYLTRLRIQKAQALLARGESVDATARAVGYPNAAYFSAVFKRFTGSTPGRLRRSASPGCTRPRGGG